MMRLRFTPLALMAAALVLAGCDGITAFAPRSGQPRAAAAQVEAGAAGMEQEQSSAAEGDETDSALDQAGSSEPDVAVTLAEAGLGGLELSTDQFVFGDTPMSQGVVTRVIEIRNSGSEPVEIDKVEPT